MEKINIKANVINNQMVEFQYYRDGELYYMTPDKKFLFPVPISDTGKGTFKREDKAIFFMRWMRKFNNDLN